MEDPISNKPIKCLHCGNETLMKQIGEYKWGSKDVDVPAQDYDFGFSYDYELYACPVCHKVTLLETYGDETMQCYNSRGEVDWFDEVKTLYPISSVDSRSIPNLIREAFESALKTRSIDNNVCLMALRRTLELIMKDKGATKWGLKDKIEEIAEKGVLPETLKEASSLAKVLGDSAAHGDISAVDKFDVDSMAGFVEYIIEYLYVLPYKIDQYKRWMKAKEDSE